MDLELDGKRALSLGAKALRSMLVKLADHQGADLESFKRDFVKTMRPSLIGRFAETKKW